MDKYEQLRAASESVDDALGNYYSKFLDVLGESLLDENNTVNGALFSLVDLLSNCVDTKDQLVGYIEERYTQFREKAFAYLYDLHDGLDGNDPRRDDYFWDNPASEPDYLNRHDFNDSYVEEGLRQIRRHPSFESAITAESEEAFFEDENRQNYALRCLRDPDLEG